jgi:DNA-binding LacI/PurR family transcriptional regulator
MAAPTIFDVARRAGVSKSTVSKVLTRAPHVSKVTRERVEAAIADLNYHPNVAARRFQSRRSQLIGMCFPTIGEVPQLPLYFSAFMGGAAAVAGRHGYDLVWLVSAADREHYEGYARVYLRREVDGLLLTSMLPSDPRVAALQQAQCPFVIVGRYNHAEVCTVDVDNVAVGYLATRHLLELGHTRIALLNGPPEYLYCQDRYTGYARALEESGVTPAPEYVSWTLYSEANGYEVMRSLCALSPHPTAFVVTDTSLQSGCLRALQDEGVRLPEDGSLVGVDSAMPVSPRPAITSVIQPVTTLAATAATLLLQLIAGEQPDPRQVVIDPTLVEGASTAPPSPLVASA